MITLESLIVFCQHFCCLDSHGIFPILWESLSTYYQPWRADVFTPEPSLGNSLWSRSKVTLLHCCNGSIFLPVPVPDLELNQSIWQFRVWI